MEENYTLLRSNRKTVALRVLPDGTLEVRCPLRMSRADIDSMIARHERWIENSRARLQQRAEAHPEPDEAQRERLIAKAKAELPPLVARYAQMLGVSPAGISITGARTRFGSCSGKNRLSFTWRLMAYPTECVEAVVAHELCHIVHKNHQKGFYELLLSVMPDYYERAKKLKG